MVLRPCKGKQTITPRPLAVKSELLISKFSSGGLPDINATGLLMQTIGCFPEIVYPQGVTDRVLDRDKKKERVVDLVTAANATQ